MIASVIKEKVKKWNLVCYNMRKVAVYVRSNCMTSADSCLFIKDRPYFRGGAGRE